MNVKIESGIEDVLAQKTVFTGLRDSNLQTLDGDGILGTHIDIAFLCADRIARDRHGFQHTVRIAFKHGTIHESTGVALVGVTCNILHRAGRAVRELPLETGGESAAATAAQTGLEDLIDDLFLRHAGQGLFQSLVAVEGKILIDVLGIDHAAVAKRDSLLMLVELDFVKGLAGFLILCAMILVDQMLHGTALEQMFGNDLVDIVHLHAGIERAFGINDDDRASLAQTEAAGTDHLDFLVQPRLLDFLFKTLNDLRRSG